MQTLLTATLAASFLMAAAILAASRHNGAVLLAKAGQHWGKYDTTDAASCPAITGIRLAFAGDAGRGVTAA